MRDRMVFRPGSGGRLLCQAYEGGVYRRDAAMPEDYGGIVYNPDRNPVYLSGERAFIRMHSVRWMKC